MVGKHQTEEIPFNGFGSIQYLNTERVSICFPGIWVYVGHACIAGFTSFVHPGSGNHHTAPFPAGPKI